MSASRERKKRQEYYANGGVDKKAVREAELKATQRKSTILYSVIGIVFVAVTALLLVYNSGILQRKAAAVTIDDTNYTADDVAFYYYESYLNLYNTVVSQYGSYGPNMIGLDSSASLKDQKAFGSTSEDAQTWDEYFKEQAVETMRFVVAAKAAAEADGYAMNEEDEEYIAERIDEMKTLAKTNGMSYGSYLSYAYGSLMTKGCFEENLEDYTLATSYASAYTDSLTYTEDEVRAVYEANPNSYDSVSYIRVQIDATPDYDDAGQAIEYTEEETAQGWEDTKAAGQALLDAYNAGEDLEAAAEAYDFAEYYTNDNALYAETAYVQWCFEDGRQAGDVTLIEDEASGRCHLVVFRDRFLDEQKTVDVRHILITADSIVNDDGSEATNEQIKAKAEEIYAMWDGTEENFIDLAQEYSQDTNAALGGIYEAVTEGYMVDTYNDWIFDESRKAGDSGLVETAYGWHIMYFIGDNNPIWYVNAENTLVNSDYNTWRAELLETVGDATTHEKGMNYVG